MKRRDFIALLAAWPAAAHAQQPAVPVIGLLHSGSAAQNAARLRSYFAGLAEAGYVEGKTVRVEYRWADGDSGKLAALAADLVERRVAVITTPASTPATIAAKKATATIPIVFAIGADPVELGIVESLARPGGNATGVTSLNTELAAKRLGLFRELVPKATRFYAMVNPTSQLTGPYLKDLDRGAASAGLHVDILHASTDAEIDAAITAVATEPGGALLSASDSFYFIRRPQIIALAQRHAVPMAFDTHEYVEDGGLMSYGSDFSDVLAVAGRYTGRILKGENPAELPVAQSNKYELALNLRTARALGLTVPPRVLALADQVIE